MRYIGLVLIGLLLAGCSPTLWAKPGSTRAEFQRDAYACERDVAYLPPVARANLTPSWGPPADGGLGQSIADLGTVLARRGQAQGMFDRCMEASGYHKEK